MRSRKPFKNKVKINHESQFPTNFILKDEIKKIIKGHKRHQKSTQDNL
jgi:hypothetical protein